MVRPSVGFFELGELSGELCGELLWFFLRDVTPDTPRNRSPGLCSHGPRPTSQKKENEGGDETASADGSTLGAAAAGAQQVFDKGAGHRGRCDKRIRKPKSA